MMRSTPEWWDRMADLYRRSNALMGTDPDFTALVLADPTFHSQTWLLLSPDKTRLQGLVRVVDHEVSCLAIEPDERRQGHGRRIMEWLRDHHQPFHLSCLGTNHDALAFYRSLPWLQEGPTVEHISRRQKICYTLVYFDCPRNNRGPRQDGCSLETIPN